jgi:hypothetical protein
VRSQGLELELASLDPGTGLTIYPLRSFDGVRFRRDLYQNALTRTATAGAVQLR